MKTEWKKMPIQLGILFLKNNVMLRTHLVLFVIAIVLFAFTIVDFSITTVSAYLSMFVFYHLILMTAKEETKAENEPNLVQKKPFIFQKLIPGFLIVSGIFTLYAAGIYFYQNLDQNWFSQLFDLVFILILIYLIYLLITQKYKSFQ